MLKPHLDVFTQEILFPYLCLSDSDKELWSEDPVEYLRKEFGMRNNISLLLQLTNPLRSYPRVPQPSHWEYQLHYRFGHVPWQGPLEQVHVFHCWIAHEIHICPRGTTQPQRKGRLLARHRSFVHLAQKSPRIQTKLGAYAFGPRLPWILFPCGIPSRQSKPICCTIGLLLIIFRHAGFSANSTTLPGKTKTTSLALSELCCNWCTTLSSPCVCKPVFPFVSSSWHPRVCVPPVMSRC